MNSEPDGCDGVKGAPASSLARALTAPMSCRLSTGLFRNMLDIHLPRMTTRDIIGLGM